MILSFADKETERVWNGLKSRKLPPQIQDKALMKLAIINRARTLNDLRTPPGNRLEQLKGDRNGSWSIRINDQWRVCLNWD